MENVHEVYREISAANMDYRAAVARSTGISSAKERVKNLLFNYRETILQALRNEELLQRDIDLLKEQRTKLEDELEAVDDENNELRRKIREMESSNAPKKRKSKTKEPKVLTAVVEVEE